MSQRTIGDELSLKIFLAQLFIEKAIALVAQTDTGKTIAAAAAVNKETARRTLLTIPGKSKVIAVPTGNAFVAKLTLAQVKTFSTRA